MDLSLVAADLEKAEASYHQKFYRPIYKQYVENSSWKHHFIVRGTALVAALQATIETVNHLFATMLWGIAAVCCGFKNKYLNQITKWTAFNGMVCLYLVGEGLTASLITPIFLKNCSVAVLK